MPKSSNQKLKLIYLMKILLERTDETHSITMSEIIDALAAYDISAELRAYTMTLKISEYMVWMLSERRRIGLIHII